VATTATTDEGRIAFIADLVESFAGMVSYPLKN
jgi:hypothetical protein